MRRFRGGSIELDGDAIWRGLRTRRPPGRGGKVAGEAVCDKREFAGRDELQPAGKRGEENDAQSESDQPLTMTTNAAIGNSMGQSHQCRGRDRAKISFKLPRTFSWQRASLCLRRSQRSTRGEVEEHSFTHRTVSQIEWQTTDKDCESCWFHDRCPAANNGRRNGSPKRRACSRHHRCVPISIPARRSSLSPARVGDVPV